jgi:D-3-phosphoglycerate dehydrogenase
MKQKVIITAFAHPILKKSLEAAGFEVIESFKISYEELSASIGSFTGMIVTTRLKIDKILLDKAISLQWIGRLGSGMEMIDHVYASSKGIQCVSSPEGNRDSVGEQVIGMILSILHKIDLAANEVRKGVWLRDENRGTELGGKTVGIIGYGNTGWKLAQLLSSFHVNVLAYDGYKTGFSSGYIQEASLQEIQEHADIISFHLPLTEETYHYADFRFFQALKRSPVLINASRGKVVDTAALIRALDEKLISAAGLDVLENESLASYSSDEKALFQNLVTRNNVLITPHIAGYSHEALVKMATVVLDKLGIRVNVRFSKKILIMHNSNASVTTGALLFFSTQERNNSL